MFARSGISKISIFKNIWKIVSYNKLSLFQAILLSEKNKRIDILWEIVKYRASLAKKV
jgi:hypothetical protein